MVAGSWRMSNTIRPASGPNPNQASRPDGTESKPKSIPEYLAFAAKAACGSVPAAFGFLRDTLVNAQKEMKPTIEKFK